LSAPQDGPCGQAKGEMALCLARHSTHLLHKGGGRLERLSPEHVHVNDGGQRGNGGRGATATVDGDMRDLLAANIGICTDDPVEFSLVIKWLRFCPGAP